MRFTRTTPPDNAKNLLFAVKGCHEQASPYCIEMSRCFLSGHTHNNQRKRVETQLIMQHTLKIAGLVLAGGQGRRMHYADKAFMDIDHKPCIDWVITRLEQQCSGIAISANGNPQRFSAWHYPVLPDTYFDVGPLAGLLSGLEWAEAAGFDALLSVPVDTPFIPHDLAGTLLPAPSYAVYAEQRHSLVALWPVTQARAVLAAQLTSVTEQNRKQTTRVCTLAYALNAQAIDFSHLYPSDPFVNINTPEDLHEVRSLGQTQSGSCYRGA